MRRRLNQAATTTLQAEARSPLPRLAAVVGLGLVVTLFAPFVPIVAGVLLLVAVAMYIWSPDLRPYVESIVRIPVASPATRHTRLALFAGAGIALVVMGSVTSSVRGTWRSTSEQRDRQEEAGANVTKLIDRAQNRLDTGNILAAEAVLLDARVITDLDPARMAEIDELLGRIHRSGDPETIRSIVAGLEPQAVEALESGSSVPTALDFGEPALTDRAVGRAHQHQ
jgi:hypothetical protein